MADVVPDQTKCFITSSMGVVVNVFYCISCIDRLYVFILSSLLKLLVNNCTGIVIYFMVSKRRVFIST